MSKQLAKAVREVLDRVPCSDRALAREAGVAPSTLSRIRSGERGCSADIAESVADALARWAEDCRTAETDLRRTLEQEGSSE